MPSNADPTADVTRIESDAIDQFNRTLVGDLILPHHNEYTDARDTWNGLIDTRPAIIARVQNPDDVSAALDFADSHDLEFSIRGNAHHQAGSALIEDGLVIDLEDLTQIDINTDAETVTVGSGLTPGDVLPKTLEHGYGFPTGSADKVGISGSTLNGGIGWMRGANGLGVDALQEVELVTADSTHLTVSEESHPDLFRGICGAGPNFGIITSLTFDLYETSPNVDSVSVFYPVEEADHVLREYRHLEEEAPDELTTMVLNGETPHLPDLPEDVQGVPAIAIMGCYNGNDGRGAEVCEPFTEITEPVLDMSGEVPYMMLHELGGDLFPNGDLYSQRSLFVDELTDTHLNIIADSTEDSPSPANGVGIWSLGGAIGDGGENALPWMDASYMITVEGHWLDDANTDANLEWVRGVEQELRSEGGYSAYAGFVGVEEQADESWPHIVYGDEYDRLAELKAEYDPENRFRTNINIQPEP